TLSYEKTPDQMTISSLSAHENTLLIMFWNTLQQSLQNINKNLTEVNGHFILDNNIQIGGGLGFSAALCVVITRWLIWSHWLSQKKLFPFAQHLENIFHGKSSGADIAGALSDYLVHFDQSGSVHEIHVHWQPRLYLSYTGVTKVTETSINQVKKINQQYPKRARVINKEMRESVHMIEDALNVDEQHGLSLLASAIEHAHHCFEEWELITPEIQKHIDQLYAAGAIAVKPTGAGAGGYLLSLWENTPPATLPFELIPVVVPEHI
ncbi:MAG: hypothetical protein ABL857_07675, partial [Rickettsiales bacterium]